MDDGRTIMVATGADRARPLSPGPAVGQPQVAGTGTAAAERRPGPGRVPGILWLAVPGMVLLAAAAIFAGYHWLQIIPDGSLRPSGFLVAVAFAPVTFGLTRHRTAGWASILRRLARAAAGVMPLLALVVLVTHATGWTRALGVTSLVLAASTLALAAMSEQADHYRP
jgi:hypothetical protein